jgi:glycosyltransferase involved in cell wall biosynthesis
MKILIVCLTDLKNEPRVIRQIHQLKKRHELTCIGLADPDEENVNFLKIHKEKNLFFTFIYLSFLILGLFDTANKISNKVFESLKTEIQIQNFDLIIAHDIFLLPFCVGIKNRSALLFDAHEYYPAQFENERLWKIVFQRYIIYLCKNYLSHCEKIITVNEGIADEYYNNFSIRPEVIINASEFFNVLPTPVKNDKIRIIHHGGATPSRKIENMIKMMDYTDERFTLTLMMVPSDIKYLDFLKTYAKKRPNIEFIDPVPMADIIYKSNEYDIGLYILEPQNFNQLNALPNKIFEFIQARLMIAIGPSPEMSRIVRQFDLGIVTSDFDPRTMAESLNKLTSEQICQYKNNSHKAAAVISSDFYMQKLERIIDTITTIPSNQLFLFTGSYPYNIAAEDTFLNPEIPFLENLFSNVAIFPRNIKGSREKIPTSIIINSDFSNMLNINKILKMFVYLIYALTSVSFYKEILKRPKIIFQFLSLVRLISFFGESIKTKKWIIHLIKQKKVNLTRTIFYTYWCDSITMGIGFAKETYPNMKLISRAHGYDIYEERYEPPYIPFRPDVFHYLDKLFLASKDAQNYLINKYPEYSNIFDIAILGVKETNFITKFSDDEIFRIVSCSNLVPVKRIGLLIKGLSELGRIKSNRHFFWTHIGEGPLRNELENQANAVLPPNVQFKFLGYVPNPDVINYYRNYPVDLFINMSESEGGNPVSIMEAQSCGIPVIASAAGGNTEIVSNRVGWLLSVHPSPEEIAQGIITVMDNPQCMPQLKSNSKINWEERYNAEKNFRIFMQKLSELMKN